MVETDVADSAHADTEVTKDAFLGGHLVLRQPGQGHRAGSDAVLLAAAAPAEMSGLVLDVGSGVGAAGFAFAALRPGTRFGLVEKDPRLAALARENLAANGFAARASVHQADVLDAASRRAAGVADVSAALVLTNPPFLDPKRVRSSPDAGRRAAHVMPSGASLEAWIAACLALLADGGLFVMIHRPDALPAMLAALAGRAGDIMLKPIAPQAGQPAVRLLLRAKKASRGPLAIAAPFILHEGKGFTREAEAVHRGETLLAW
jgi:tRNA1(Val) A37 N6-methylase TrmN6